MLQREKFLVVLECRIYVEEAQVVVATACEDTRLVNALAEVYVLRVHYPVLVNLAGGRIEHSKVFVSAKEERV